MTGAPQWVPVLILFALLGLAYVGMWRGWRRRALRHELPPLVPVADDGALGDDAVVANGRYFGTTVAGDWLDRVVAQGLGTRSSCRLVVSTEGLDVLRPRAGFRIRRSALLGTRLESGIAGKVVPPAGILVVTWQHGDLRLDTGFRLDALAGGGAADGRGAASMSSPAEVHAHVAGLVDALTAEH